jgi:ATP-dependent exoDNAse (exonuclease V) alpha subunit
MIVLGHGGTGKSMLIGAITETFKALNSEEKLAKCATSGVAAVIIGGQTLHSWAAIPINTPRKENWAESDNQTIQKRRKQNIVGRQFLICDEVSMCTKQLKYRGSEIVSRVRASEGVGNASESFGGMDVIDFGDFHQFPPVGNANAALYCERPETDDAHALKGRTIFLDYDHVVILREQMRITDDVWTGILSRLRVGECTEHDIKEVQKLVLTNPACEIPDFSTSPWCDATLITPRNATKDLWNTAALERHCRMSGNRKYIISAEDTIKETGATPDKRTRLTIAGLKNDTTKNLKMRVELAVGMKAMVVLNIATEADLANGTRGTVQGFALDPREERTSPNEEGHVHLRYPPPVIYFKPEIKPNTVFEGVPEGIIPISPSMIRFSVDVEGGKVTIERRQLAIVPAYAFTDYKSQGQTMEYVIVDISKPPTGLLSPFSVYVALSRSRGRKTIRILRNFDPTLLMHHPSEDLRKDMARLERLDEQTKEAFEEAMML